MNKPSLQGHPLEPVLAAGGSTHALRQREADTFANLSGGANRAVIFGCGALGRIILAGARRAGVIVSAFGDNNSALHGQEYEGIPILSPADAVAAFGRDAYFIVGVFNASAPSRQLRALGCARIVPYAAFYWQFADSMADAPGIERPHLIAGRAEEICAGYDCLSDFKSRREFAAQIATRYSLDFDQLPQPDDPAEIYFPRELMRLCSDEVLVDCGAFDGDSIRLFRKWTSGQYRHIYACEPDASNRARLEGFIRSLRDGEPSRITVLPFAVGDRDGVVHFDASGTAGSHLTADNGMHAVDCRRLDTVLSDLSPTIVKMDIEGAEPSAIAGAKETIRRARPILSVCAYHRCEHLWTLPLLMKAALPEYRIHLRRYAEECWETVYYAVPPERAIQDA